MKWTQLACVGGCLAWFAAAAAAQNPELGPPIARGPCCQPPPLYGNPNCPPTMPNLPGTPGAMPGTTPPWITTPGTTTPGATTPGATTPGTTAPGTTPPATNPEASQPATGPSDSLAQAPEAGTQASASVAPAMFGDLIGIAGRRVVIIPPGATPPANAVRLGGNIIAVVAPLPLHASYKIMEGENPRPQNRAYVSYTFYDDVDRLFPASLVGRSNLNRETLGFEQTYAQGESSIGLRLPFLQLTGDSQVQDNEVGDLSIIYKHAFIDDRQTGNLLSGGLVVTVPTGQGLEIEGESTLHSTVFQPFVGYIYTMNDAFIEGFSSVAVPTDARDVTLMFNSIAAGYFLYRDDQGDQLIRTIVPQLELHLNTPFTHRGLTSTPVNFSDSLDLTAGCHVRFRAAEVGFAFGTPLTGPKPYDWEGNGNLTFHW